MSKEQLLQMMDEANKVTHDLIQMVTPDQEVYPGWTIKEFISHLAGWDDACVQAMNAFLRGEPPVVIATRGVDHYNLQTVAERQNLNLDQAVKEWELAHQEYKRMISSFTEDQLNNPITFPWAENGTLGHMIEEMANHELYHNADIRAHLKKNVA